MVGMKYDFFLYVDAEIWNLVLSWLALVQLAHSISLISGFCAWRWDVAVLRLL